MDKRIFRKASSILAGVEAAEKKIEKITGRKCSWDDPADVNYYRRDKRTLARIARIPDDGLCPECKEYLGMDMSKWVIKGSNITRCRSCNMIIKRFGRFREVVISGTVFSDVVDEVKVELRDVKGMRWDAWMLALGLSHSEFATLCNGGRWYVVGEEPAGSVVLNRRKACTVNRDVLEQIRGKLKMGLSRFAEEVLWVSKATAKKWKIRDDKATKIDVERAKDILENLAKCKVKTADNLGDKVPIPWRF